MLKFFNILIWFLRCAANVVDLDFVYTIVANVLAESVVDRIFVNMGELSMLVARNHAKDLLFVRMGELGLFAR